MDAPEGWRPVTETEPPARTAESGKQLFLFWDRGLVYVGERNALQPYEPETVRAEFPLGRFLAVLPGRGGWVDVRVLPSAPQFWRPLPDNPTGEMLHAAVERGELKRSERA
jgi:hypothetical protein